MTSSHWTPGGLTRLLVITPTGALLCHMVIKQTCSVPYTERLSLCEHDALTVFMALRCMKTVIVTLCTVHMAPCKWNLVTDLHCSLRSKSAAVSSPSWPAYQRPLTWRTQHAVLSTKQGPCVTAPFHHPASMTRELKSHCQSPRQKLATQRCQVGRCSGLAGHTNCHREGQQLQLRSAEATWPPTIQGA